MSWDVTGKNVLITGGTSGIGRATAAQLARLGAHVTITSRTLATAQTTADELEDDTGADIEPAQLDLSSLDAVRAFAATYADRHDRLDVLINNAGTMAGRRRPPTTASNGPSPSTTSAPSYSPTSSPRFSSRVPRPE